MRDSPNLASRRLNKCPDLLVEKKWISATKDETVQKEFDELTESLVVKESFRSFKQDSCRLDEFWVDVIKLKSSPNFLDFVKMMLILSHGNACLERGFSINKELLVENLTQKSLVAQRMVYDVVTAAGGEHDIVIDKEMIHAARNARPLQGGFGSTRCSKEG